MSNLKMVVTDLDGTLLKDDRTVSPQDLQTLNTLGELGIIRVIATGRNLKKVAQVIPGNYPFDYVIFSSGAGIIDWKSRKELFSRNLSEPTTASLVHLFVSEGLNFKFSESLPNNDQYYYWFPSPDEETNRYSKTYNPEGVPLIMDRDQQFTSSCQFLVFLPNNMEYFESIREKVLSIVPGVSVICASSPYRTPYLWLEVFGSGVSKGHAIDWLNKYTGTTHLHTIGIGNDYNDVEMLEHTHHAYVTENAPEELKRRYKVCRSNEESGFTSAVEAALEE